MQPEIGIETAREPDREAPRERDGEQHRACRRDRDRDDERCDERPDQIAARETQRPQRGHRRRHRVDETRDRLTDEHEGRERDRGGEQQQPGRLEIGGVRDALRVVAEVAHGNVQEGGVIHVRIAQQPHRALVKRVDVRARLQAARAGSAHDRRPCRGGP